MEITSEHVIDIPHMYNYSINSSTRSSTSTCNNLGFPVGKRNKSALIRLERKRFSKAKKRIRGRKFMQWHAVFAFLNPLLIGVLEVKCQGAAISPFALHPGDMWTFLVATLVYCFAFAANIKCPKRCYARLSGRIAFLSGSLSSVSVFSIFLPSLLGRLAFFLWIVLPFVLFRTLIKYWILQWPKKATLQLLINVRNRFVI